MTILQAILLGIVQGLTEFLPISSSAHLVLVPYLAGWEFPTEQVFVFDVLVQMGTLVAVIIYFWKDLVHILTAWVQGLLQKKPFSEPDARLGWFLILATIPAGLGALVFKDMVEAAFNSPIATGLFLFITALLLILAEVAGSKTRNLSEMNWKDALWIGTFQFLALLPGISRSGSTISGGMTRQFNRADAGRFSFLMSIPVMLAAGLLSVLDLIQMPNFSQFLPIVVAGFISAAIVGYLSIAWFLNFLRKQPLYGFAIYCTVLAVVVLLTSAF